MSRRVLSLIAAGALAATVSVPASAGLLSSVTAAVDAQIASATGTTSALVHVAPTATLGALAGLVEARGLLVASTFESIRVLHVVGDAAVLRGLVRTGLVERIEFDAPIQTFTATSHDATGGQAVLDGSVTLADGTVIDGSGVGVAIVDSGIDDTHGDLANTVRNVKAIPLFGGAVDLPATDIISLGGHGTHVAGIVGGSGAASGGENHGAAPGSSLYGVSAGTLISVHSGLEALEWVLDNHDQVSPAIRVVNNSWGSSGNGTASAGSALGQMIDALVADGVTVVWAAGNDGGNGSAARTSPTCVQQTPGNICVAAYDDAGTGTRTGTIAGFSSRGKDGAVATYPDIAAPGANIISTCRPYLPICATGLSLNPNYATLSGTSMAAPHIAGIVAQLYQANPNLTPAQVEDILEDTARPLAAAGTPTSDPANATTSTTFDAGHGLVNVEAAIQRALNS